MKGEKNVLLVNINWGLGTGIIIDGKKEKYSLNLMSQDTVLAISKLGDRAGLIGACLLSRSKVLDML